MTKERSLVRASEIGAWGFCQRAWWLANVQGAPHRNPQRLKQGTATHLAHGQAVVRAQRLRKAGLLLLAVGVILVILWLLWWGVGSRN